MFDFYDEEFDWEYDFVERPSDDYYWLDDDDYDNYNCCDKFEYNEWMGR